MFTTRLSIGWPSSLLLRFIDTLGYFQNSIHDRQWPWMVFSRIHWVNSPEYHSMNDPHRNFDYSQTKRYKNLCALLSSIHVNNEHTDDVEFAIEYYHRIRCKQRQWFFGQRPWSFLGGSSLFIQVIWQFAYTWSVSQPGYADACDGSNVGSRDSWVRFKLWISKFEFRLLEVAFGHFRA